MELEIFHGSGEIVEYPEIRKTKYTKDFSWGFYCTKKVYRPLTDDRPFMPSDGIFHKRISTCDSQDWCTSG